MSTDLAPFDQLLPGAVGMDEHRVAMAALTERVMSSPDLPRVECPVKHHFSNGVYGREIFMPAGALVAGRIHKHACLNVISQGRVEVSVGEGTIMLTAPATWVSEPGSQRLVFVHEDCIWTTAHATQETDIAKIEAEMVCDTPAEYLAYTQRIES